MRTPGSPPDEGSLPSSESALDVLSRLGNDRNPHQSENFPGGEIVEIGYDPPIREINAIDFVAQRKNHRTTK